MFQVIDSEEIANFATMKPRIKLKYDLVDDIFNSEDIIAVQSDETSIFESPQEWYEKMYKRKWPYFMAIHVELNEHSSNFNKAEHKEFIRNIERKIRMILHQYIKFDDEIQKVNNAINFKTEKEENRISDEVLFEHPYENWIRADEPAHGIITKCHSAYEVVFKIAFQWRGPVTYFLNMCCALNCMVFHDSCIIEIFKRHDDNEAEPFHIYAIDPYPKNGSDIRNKLDCCKLPPLETVRQMSHEYFQKALKSKHLCSATSVVCQYRIERLMTVLQYMKMFELSNNELLSEIVNWFDAVYNEYRTRFEELAVYLSEEKYH